MRVLLVGLAWLAGWWLCWRVRGVPLLGDLGVDPPRVSVVIPARDEARTLPTLLAGLAEQTMPAADIVVVDDHSSDATSAVAVAPGARVVTAPPLPAGWTGKAAALAAGAREAREDVVVLLDADVEPSRYLLARLASVFARTGGLVSVQPYHRVGSWWERASAMFNVVAVMGTGIASPRLPSRHLARSPDRSPARWLQRRPPTAAFGPVMICRRDALLAHLEVSEVHGAVLEDVALARRFVAAGEQVTTFGGRDLVAFRMYDRPRALIDGWAKGFAAGAGATPLARLVLIVAWVTACLVAGWGGFAGTWVALGLYVAFAVQLLVMLRQVGRFGVATAVLFPVLATVFVALFAWSLLLTARGSVRWKGRTIRVRGT